jgi:hypothetical protein
MNEGRKGFFFEKKRQKTFANGGIWRWWCQGPQEQKSFCFFFFRKRSSSLLDYLVGLCRCAKGVDGPVKPGHDVVRFSLLLGPLGLFLQKKVFALSGDHGSDF